VEVKCVGVLRVVPGGVPWRNHCSAEVAAPRLLPLAHVHVFRHLLLVQLPFEGLLQLRAHSHVAHLHPRTGGRGVCARACVRVPAWLSPPSLPTSCHPLYRHPRATLPLWDSPPRSGCAPRPTAPRDPPLGAPARPRATAAGVRVCWSVVGQLQGSYAAAGYRCALTSAHDSCR
jgi:hypothetical protein